MIFLLHIIQISYISILLNVEGKIIL